MDGATDHTQRVESDYTKKVRAPRDVVREVLRHHTCWHDPALPDELEAAVESLLAESVAQALTEAAQAIERERGKHWQQHLRDHPFADGTSCPRDYGMHDAYARAVSTVHAVRSVFPPDPEVVPVRRLPTVDFDNEGGVR